MARRHRLIIRSSCTKAVLVLGHHPCREACPADLSSASVSWPIDTQHITTRARRNGKRAGTSNGKRGGRAHQSPCASQRSRRLA